MAGFEDSVNMAEESKDPVRIFPKVMLSGLCITGLIYVLVSISAIALVSPEDLSEGDAPLLQVVAAGAPSFPIQIFAFITIFAVAKSALINMLMASRLLYGMSKQRVLPRFLGKVHRTRRTPWTGILFTTAIAFGLIWFADLTALGGTTALLLLCVVTIVNIAVLVLRRDRVEHEHFHAPTAIPIIGAVAWGKFSGRARLPVASTVRRSASAVPPPQTLDATGGGAGPSTDAWRGDLPPVRRARATTGAVVERLVVSRARSGSAHATGQPAAHRNGAPCGGERPGPRLAALAVAARVGRVRPGPCRGRPHGVAGHGAGLYGASAAGRPG
jgi:hypothetical protein